MTELFHLKNINFSQLASERNRVFTFLNDLLPDALIIEAGSTAIANAIGKQDIDFVIHVNRDDFVKVRNTLDGQFERNADQLSKSPSGKFMKGCIIF